MENYETLRTLGQGGFGKVILGRRKGDQVQVVIKEVRLTALPPKDRDNALREVRVLSSLKHPYIVEYLESFQARGCLYIVMSYADGGDLAEKIQKQGTKCLAESEVLHYFIELALAIKYIHDRKILHRDLKGQNVFLTKDGTVKLGDFGIARVLDHTFQVCRTQIGTPYYLSPEICQGRAYNAKTDIWSLGCLLYELCTLKHAFSANGMNQLLRQIISGPVAPIPPEYSQEIRGLVDRMLTKDPAERPSINQILEVPLIKQRLPEFECDLPAPEPEKLKRMLAVPEIDAGREAKARETREKVDHDREVFLQQRREAVARNPPAGPDPEPEDDRRRTFLEARANRNRLRDRAMAGRTMAHALQAADEPEARAPPSRPEPRQAEPKAPMSLSELNAYMREQRHERRANQARAEAALQGVSIDQLVADAEREQRRKGGDPAADPEGQRDRQKRMSLSQVKAFMREQQRARRPNADSPALDMDSLIAQAEREQRERPKPEEVPTRAETPPKSGRSVLGQPKIKELFRQQREQLRVNHEKMKKVRDGAHDPTIAAEAPPSASGRPRLLGQDGAAADPMHGLEALDQMEATDSSTRPFYLQEKVIDFPVVRESDSLSYRAERIRAFLEKEVGLDKLIELRQANLGQTTVEQILRDSEPGVVILAQQLLVLEQTIDNM
jgi:NIMA (never in mitosis gene a)-related kinase